METRPPTRREEAELFFEGSRKFLRLIEAMDPLTEEEVWWFEDDLKSWFGEFAQRPGNCKMPVAWLFGPLLGTAWRHVEDYKVMPRPVASVAKEKSEEKPEEKPPDTQKETL